MTEAENRATRTALIASIRAIAQTLTPAQRQQIQETFQLLVRDANRKGDQEYGDLLSELHRHVT
jgi:hypothetical protein